jgi:hypothetical protein
MEHELLALREHMRGKQDPHDEHALGTTRWHDTSTCDPRKQDCTK